MGMDFAPTTFAGSLLVAMPSILDPAFRGSVVILCAHSPEGAMGLIVNRPAPLTTYAELRASIPESLRIPRAGTLHVGGPAEKHRCFVLHSRDYDGGRGSVAVDGHHALTATDAILHDIAAGRGPERRVIALGYAGWGPGQLEGELRDNAWLIAPADPAVTYAADDGAKWRRAAGLIGVDPEALSGAAGSA